MFFISAPIIAACCFTQTPKEWQDSQLDPIDRLAMEELISFAPPPISSDATWILPKGEEAPEWSDFLGKVVVVQSWSNADARSRQIVGATNKAIARTTTPEEVVFIMIHTPEGLESLSKYQSKHSIKAPTIIDTTGELCNQFGFYTDPTNVVIDRNGAVHYIGLGMKGLIDAADTLLAQEFDPKNKTKPYDLKSKQVELPTQYPSHSEKFGRAKNWQGKQAPPFYVEEWISKPIDIQDKVRVVEFWATWCPPCRKSIPHLNDYAEHFGESIAIIGVSNEATSKVQEFMKKTPMNYGVAIDTKAKMKSTISCSAIPLALVISSDGVVRWQGNPLQLSKKTIQQVIGADRGDIVSTKRGRWEIPQPVKSEK